MNFNLNFLKAALFFTNLLFISLAFPSPPLTNITFGLLAFCSLFIKGDRPKKAGKILLGFLIAYVLSALLSSFLFSKFSWDDDYTLALYFFAIPFVFYRASPIFNKKNLRHLLSLYSISVIVFACLALVKLFLLVQLQLENKFFYASLQKTLDFHTTDFSMLTVPAYTILMLRLFTEKKRFWLNLAGVLFLALFIFLISSRTGIIALFGVSLAALIFKFKQIQWKKILPILVIILGLSVFFFNYGYSSQRVAQTFSPNQAGRSDVKNRILIWENALCAYQNIPAPLIGTGLTNAQSYLNACYRTHDFFGYKTNFKAHNQYLQILLEAGFIGFLGFLGFLVFSLRYLFILKKPLGLFILGSFCLFFLIATPLERQIGIMSFFCFTCLFCFYHEN